MAQLIRCDECKEENPRTAFGWLTVSDASEFYLATVGGAKRLVGDYCSAKCLATAAARAADLVVGDYLR